MKRPPPFAPASVAAPLLSSLRDKERPAYGQAATVDGRGRPQVRTVHFRHVPEKATLGFAANILSPKWRELRRKRVLSGCWYDHPRSVQFRWEGAVELIEPRAAGPSGGRTLDRMWLLLRSPVRTAYWADFAPRGKVDAGRRCPNFGVVLCRPRMWDVFRMNHKDYIRSTRTIYRLKKGKWAGRRVSVLHGKDL